MTKPRRLSGFLRESDYLFVLCRPVSLGFSTHNRLNDPLRQFPSFHFNLCFSTCCRHSSGRTLHNPVHDEFSVSFLPVFRSVISTTRGITKCQKQSCENLYSPETREKGRKKKKDEKKIRLLSLQA